MCTLLRATSMRKHQKLYSVEMREHRFRQLRIWVRSEGKVAEAGELRILFLRGWRQSIQQTGAARPANVNM
eukprot:5928854-Pleurochrysis_carterae.AAC.4